ncbi:MAG: hypothetical protein C0404_12315 [Verrucomicrobia bacterium]|nr:hypothetical protein [Verrucomicrobiota bacterium]
MSVLFLNLVLWPFLVLISVPILLHLFARTRPPLYHFSSIEFILRSIRQTNRIKKPQDWIVLALRTLIFAALIFLFMQPLFFSSKRLSTPFERKNVVLIVDATASMGYTEGAKTRFASACAQASSILSGLTANDMANIIWLKAAPESVLPQMGVNFGYLQSELRKARVSSEAGDCAGAMRLAMQLLEKTEGRKEIFLVSDFQRSGWEKAELSVPPGIELMKIKMGREPGDNGAIGDVYFVPHRALVNEEIAVCCDVYNFSPEPRRRTVFAAIEETRESQDMMIPAWQKATAVFRHKFAAPGIFPVSVTVNEDSFPGDDRRWALAEIRESLRVGITGSDAETAAAWKRALDAMGWARTEAVAAGDVAGMMPFDVVMIAGDDGSVLEKAIAKVPAATTLVWSPATTGAQWKATAAASPVPVSWEKCEKERKLRIVAEGSEVFLPFAGGEFGDPARGNFLGRFAVDPAAVKGGEVLMAYDDGIPALARFKRGGSLFFWNITLRKEFSNYASRTGYLPVLGELLLASRVVAGDTSSRSFIAGERLAWRLDGDVLGAEVRLSDSEGRQVAVQEHRTARDISVVAAGGTEPGLYSWELQGQRLGYCTVNFPTAESDLRTMSVAELNTAASAGVGEGVAIHWLREGIRLWPWLLGLGLLLIFVEGFALFVFERS